jgi:hypothetical protein
MFEGRLSAWTRSTTAPPSTGIGIQVGHGVSGTEHATGDYRCGEKKSDQQAAPAGGLLNVFTGKVRKSPLWLYNTYIVVTTDGARCASPKPTPRGRT